MHCRRMDLALLATDDRVSRGGASAGISGPRCTRASSDRVLARYSEALGIDVATLRILEERP